MQLLKNDHLWFGNKLHTTLALIYFPVTALLVLFYSLLILWLLINKELQVWLCKARTGYWNPTFCLRENEHLLWYKKKVTLPCVVVKEFNLTVLHYLFVSTRGPGWALPVILNKFQSEEARWGRGSDQSKSVWFYFCEPEHKRSQSESEVETERKRWHTRQTDRLHEDEQQEKFYI